jgi:hypothetical protein
MKARSSRRGRWGGAVVVAAALLLAAPAHAVAGDAYPVSGGSLVFGMLTGTDGYRIHFSEWERGHGRHFKVVVDGHDASLTYAVPAGRAPADGIVANLGRRGRFELRLGRLGMVRRLGYSSQCEGVPGRWQRGYMIGIAHFRGERGYTSTDIHVGRIPIVIESWPAFRCHYAHGGGPRVKPRRAQVFARRGGLGFGAVLHARHSGPADQRAFFRAWMDGSAGRMWISREVMVPAPESSFVFPGGPKLPEEVTVEPPKPFAGSASFIRSPESTFSWSGDLTVEFPGMNPVRLAGPGFGAGVCGVDSCVRQEPEREPPA